MSQASASKDSSGAASGASPNLRNRTIFCHDNLEVLQGINSACIDLIYMDPPFNKKKVFTAPIGSSAEGASFSDIFREEDVKNEWLQTLKEDEDAIYGFLMGIRNHGNTYNFCYLAYMAIRLLACRRILKPTGSLYLHCDPTMSHYLKILLDGVFGEQNFRNELIWSYQTGGSSKKWFGRKHDTVLFYSKTGAYHIDLYKVKERRSEKSLERAKNPKGSRFNLAEKEFRLPNDVWHLQALNAMSKERTGYPTQKPVALLERVLQASCPEGGLVLDPFCGCATTCIAAEKLGRQWVGIDFSSKAFELVKKRLLEEVTECQELFDTEKDVFFHTTPPLRTDKGADEREQKYVYVVSNEAYDGMYKVGIASDLKRRLGSYQTSDPHRGYRLECARLTPHFRALETHIHRRFDARHEWVRAKLDAIRETLETYPETEDLAP